MSRRVAAFNGDGRAERQREIERRQGRDAQVDLGAAIQERIGDLEKSRSRTAEARAAYEAAIEHSTDSGTRKRLKKKIP